MAFISEQDKENFYNALDRFIDHYPVWILPALSAGRSSEEIHNLLCNVGIAESWVRLFLNDVIKIHFFAINALDKGILDMEIINKIVSVGATEKVAKKIVFQLSPVKYVTIDELRSNTELYNQNYVSFVDSCNKDDKIFRTFKSELCYKFTVGHDKEEMIGDYLIEIIKTNAQYFIDLMEKFKTNDRIGGPCLHNFNVIGKMSPTTLRYIKIASDLIVLFGNEINRIAEIGCAYGGQYLVMDQVFHMQEYHLFDLPPVLQLISKYLECHLLNSSYKVSTVNQHAGNFDYDLVISNLAFSEVPVKMQIKYIEKILSKSKRGYLTMNTGNIALDGQYYDGPEREKFHLPLNKLLEMLPPCEVINDTTQPFVPTQYVIVWGNERPAYELPHAFLRMDLISKSKLDSLTQVEIDREKRKAEEWATHLGRLREQGIVR